MRNKLCLASLVIGTSLGCQNTKEEPKVDFNNSYVKNTNSTIEEVSEESSKVDEGRYWEQKYGIIAGEVIPAKGDDDSTVYVFFQVHNNPNKKGIKIGSKWITPLDVERCYRGMSGMQKELYLNGKLSAVFVEGKEKTEFRKSWSSPTEYLLIGGFEVQGHKEQFEIRFKENEALKNGYNSLALELEKGNVTFYDPAVQEELRSLNESYQLHVNYLEQRTIDSFETSQDNFSTWHEDNPDQPKAYAITIGGLHKFMVKNHNSFIDYIESQESHPRVEIYQCLPDDILKQAEVNTRYKTKNVVERLKKIQE